MVVGLRHELTDHTGDNSLNTVKWLDNSNSYE